MRKVKGYDGTTIGYETNGWYLLKRYTWGNYYDWVITQDKRDRQCFMVEFDKKLENKQVRIANSYKQGIEEIKRLASI